MSNAKLSHTPTPWKLSAYDVIGLAVLSIVDAAGQEVISNTKSVKTADLIVRAVNSYDALKKLNEELLAVVKSMRLYIDTFSAEAKNSFRAGGNGEYVDGLIAKAEGK